MKEIHFKSIPENWIKEYGGLKRNTVRLIERDDIRRQVLDEWMNCPFVLKISIINTKNKEMFQRIVSDVTLFGDYYIISW